MADQSSGFRADFYSIGCVDDDLNSSHFEIVLRVPREDLGSVPGDLVCSEVVVTIAPAGRPDDPQRELFGAEVRRG